MSNDTDTKPFDFAKQAKKYKPKASAVLAVKHSGEPITVKTDTGSELARAGDYIVQTGTHDTTEIVPPSVKNGERVPGLQRTVKAPVFQVLSAEDFDALYEA